MSLGGFWAHPTGTLNFGGITYPSGKGMSWDDSGGAGVTGEMDN